jgi:hypothetical protein
MRVESLCKRITQFGFTLLETDFALDARSHQVDKLSRTKKSLTWARESSAPMVIGSPAKIADYLSLLERQDYSYLMNDGGVIQIAFVYDRGEIEQHRLSYHPCPFLIERRELERFGGGLLDFILNAFMSDLDETLLLRSPIRFDYAPSAAGHFHPASHITVNDPCCRIPVRSPLQFDTFIKFILENFYISAWQNRAVTRVLAFRQEHECLSVHDRSRAYLNWVHG